MGADVDRIFAEVEAGREAVVELTRELVRIPSVNPPGEHYRDAAEHLGRRLSRAGFEVRLHVAEDSPAHSSRYPRVNVVGRRGGKLPRPCVHLNGHLDVVPAGAGWTREPFAAEVEGGRIYGRGTADMKSGIAAAVCAVEALDRAGVELRGSLEISGSIDEESGGQAGVAWLCEQGIVDKAKVDAVIIPEPLNPDRICIGHRGVYWFKVEARGRIAHGSMPFLGVSAIDHLAHLIERIRTELQPKLAARHTQMPVVPPEARRATLNVNSVMGGQAGREPQTPCVADAGEAIFDRRFLLEEPFAEVRGEIEALLAQAMREDERRDYRLSDLMLVHPVQTPRDCELVGSLSRAIRQVMPAGPTLVASPGTYDHKHFARIGGIEQCVAYGPGQLELAHQIDEYVSIDDLVAATKVLALALSDLLG